MVADVKNDIIRGTLLNSGQDIIDNPVKYGNVGSLEVPKNDNTSVVLPLEIKK